MCRYEDAALAAWEGVQLDNTNAELKAILKKAVDLGREEHQAAAGGAPGGAAGKTPPPSAKGRR